ncbi:MAG TPA: TIGR02300 family protein [Thermoanaerobaculia bacterium]|nr:TIGR02300 family protein [Thermoanaerobaculia bacterium]
MAETKLGSKHECYSCGTKFYDLGKPEPICPKCGANQTHAAPSTQLAATQAARKKRKAEVARTFDDEPEEVAGEVVADDDLIDDDLVGADLGADDEEEDIDDDEE